MVTRDKLFFFAIFRRFGRRAIEPSSFKTSQRTPRWQAGRPDGPIHRAFRVGPHRLSSLRAAPRSAKTTLAGARRPGPTAWRLFLYMRVVFVWAAIESADAVSVTPSRAMLMENRKIRRVREAEPLSAAGHVNCHGRTPAHFSPSSGRGGAGGGGGPIPLSRVRGCAR